MEQQYISDDDFIAVLRTIWLFLDSQNFKETSLALISECERYGYPEVKICPSGALTCTASKCKMIGELEDKFAYKTYRLESSVNNINEGFKVRTSIYLCFTDTSKNHPVEESTGTQNNVKYPIIIHHESLTKKKDECEETPTQIVFKNELQNVSSPCTFVNQVVGEGESENKSPGPITRSAKQQTEKNSFQILHQDDTENSDKTKMEEPCYYDNSNSITTSTTVNEKPTRNKIKQENVGTKRPLQKVKRTISKSAQDNGKVKNRPLTEKHRSQQHSSCPCSNGKEVEKTVFEPCVCGPKTSSSSSEEKLVFKDKERQCICGNVDCHELKTRFRHLQTEHRKLMSVAAELTMALQSNILGQSENLSCMLNNCKTIYPDLFSSSDNESKTSRQPNKVTTEDYFNNKTVDLKHPNYDDNCSSDSPRQDFKINGNKSDSQFAKFLEQEENCSSEFNKTEIEPSFKILEGTIQNTMDCLKEEDDCQAESNKILSPNSFEVINNVTKTSEYFPEQDNETPAPQSEENINVKSAIEDIFPIQSSEVESERSNDDAANAVNNSICLTKEESLNIMDAETSERQEKTQPPSIFISDNRQSYNQIIISPSSYFELNFRKLKNDLSRCPLEKRSRLLQALRWRITKSETNTRDVVMGSYIRHDLLSLHTSPFCNLKRAFLEELYCPKDVETPHPIQESIARLVNAFASLTLGRDYLCQDDDVLTSLLLPLTVDTHHSKCKINDVTRDMLLATLQKLSLRNRQRHYMISAGLVEYLITFLSINHNILSDYCMEYSTALFMNLCLHKEAREACKARSMDVIALLVKLLSGKHHYCIPYINGAMYSLLSDPVINREALRMDLAKFIEHHIKHSDGEIKEQLEIILKVHLEGDEDAECVCDPSTELQEEVDLLESELDVDDQVLSGATGEELLQDYKLIFTMKGYQVPNQFTRLCQPITPRSKTDITQETPTNCPKASRLFMVQSPRETTPNETAYNETNTDKIREESVEPIYKKRCVSKPSNQSPHLKDESLYSKIEEEICRVPEYASFQHKEDESVNRMEGEQRSPPHTSSSSSTEKSFSEETKQFYHKPSAKRGIFNSDPPHSFTTTITGSILCEPMSAKSPLRFSYQSGKMYSKHAPPACYKANYKQSFFEHQNCKPCCSSLQNKYSCHCYNEVKSFVERTVIDQNRNEHKEHPKTPNNSLNKIKVNRQVSTRSVLTPDSRTDHEENILSFPQDLQLDNNDDDDDDEKSKSICPIHGTSECECYRAVFKSRPKILRTP